MKFEVVGIINEALRLMYTGKVCREKHQQQQHGTVTAVLALANRNDPICVALPKKANASTIVTLTCRCHQHFHLKNIANGNTALEIERFVQIGM
jgi:hypothetical protein